MPSPEVGSVRVHKLEFRKRLLVVVFFLIAVSCSAFAVEGSRKIVHRVPPAYPQMARQYQISGIVKLELTVAADGSVRNTKVVAGHPMLTSAAVDAVSRWRYEPGTESVESIEVSFSK